MAKKKTKAEKNKGKGPQEPPQSKDTKKGAAVGEQIPLLDVGPKNLKKIIPVAKQYRAAVKQRMQAGEEEVALKSQLLELIEAADLTRDKEGKIKFKADGFVITVTPRDNLVQVKEKSPKK